MNKKIDTLFKEEAVNNWKEEWVGMPEYDNKEDTPPAITATFKFRTAEDFEVFKEHLRKTIYNNAKVFDGMQRKDIKSTWFPLKEKANKYRYKNES